MKKTLFTMLLMANVYATPPCEYEHEKICIYLYKGAMSSEAILINLTTKPVMIKEAIVTLDGTTKRITNLKLNSNQPLTLLKSKYDDYIKQPNLS